MIIGYSRLLAFTLTALYLCSCSRGGTSGSYIREVVDPDGITVFENGPVPKNWYGILQPLILEEIATIGRAEGPDEQLISATGFYMHVSTGPNGQVGYVERTPTELRVYDGNGNFLWRAGRSGEGPGEWRNASHLEYVTDIGWVLITYPYRLIIFDEAGTMVDSKSVRDFPGIRSSAHINLHPSGIIWSWTIEPSNKEISYGYIYKGNWMTLEAVEIDKLHNSTLTNEGSDSAFLTMMPRSMAVDLKGRLWLNHTIEYQLEVYAAEDNERWRVRREYEYSPYTRAERERAESTLIAGGGGRNWYSRLHKHRPPIQGLKWIDEDELWVFTSTYIDSPIVQVDVFDSKGVYQRAFKANETLRNGQFHDGTVWLLSENEEGVPQLNRSRYTFRK